MDASISSNSMSLILEEKVYDLESKLAHTGQALKTKEHVLHLQQEQIKKLEEMYKKCLEDVANVTCEHKKTLNDLENLRIILKSYERRMQCNNYVDFQSQVDLIPPPCSEEVQHSSIHENQRAELDKINITLLLQNEKSDQIIELLSNATEKPLEAIRQYIEKLEAAAAESSLRESSRHLENNENPRSHIFTTGEECERNYSASYRLNDLDTMSFFIENGCQTILLQEDSSTNIPFDLKSSSVQAVINNVNFGTNTTTKSSAYKQVQCQLQMYSSIMTQNSLFDEMYTLKTALLNLEQDVVVNENIYNYLETTLANCEKLIGCVNSKNSEILELRDNIDLLSAFIERQSFLNVEQIKELCKHVILQAGEDCMCLIQENSNLKAQNKMLLQEMDTMKSANSEVPRIVIELSNQNTQTDYKNVLERGDDDEDYRKRLVDLSKELAEAYSSIKYLKCRNEALEINAQTLKDLKDLFVTLNLETNHLYRSQLVEEKGKYEGEQTAMITKIQLLEKQLADNNNKKKRYEICTNSTQIYGWAPLEEQANVLRAENNELAKLVMALKEELETERVNQIALKELNTMCLKLGQNINENAMVKQENVQLKQQLEELQQAQDYNEIREVQIEISKLRADNKELSEGVKQLGRIVYLNPKNMQHKAIHSRVVAHIDSPETDPYASSDNTSSNECICVTHYQHSDLNLNVGDSSNDLEELKCLCEDLSARLQCKHAGSNNVDNKLELLASLENDLKVLMKEFLDFKWSSQNEHQKLIMKHADLLTQNEELINCLNQYKSVNESLLQSHYDLEKAKNNTTDQHQHLLEEYLKLQEQVDCHSPQKVCAHFGVNTVLIGGDLVDAVQIKMENIDLQKQNVKLRQEVDNLLMQVNDQHIICLRKLQENIELQTCKHCENVLNALQTLNVNFSKVNEENIQLKADLSEKDCKLDEALQKCAKLVNEIRINAQIQEERDLNNKQLISDIKRLQSATAASEKLHNEMHLLQRHCQQTCAELSECQMKSKNLEQEIIKYQAEIDMLQNAITNVGSIREDNKTLSSSNEALKQELAQLRIQLKAANDTKLKVESDFESYIRTNNLLQQTMNTQNTNLKGELQLIKDENEKLLLELQDMQGKQTTSKTELVRVVNECANYKVQLENMAKRIDAHMKEHLDYKTDVDEVKRNLQAEIANLRKMLEMHNESADTFEIRDYSDGNSVENLKAFINAKEMEIDYLMGQKIQALEAMGQFANEKDARKDQSQTVRTSIQENFRVQLNFRKAARDLSAQSRPSPGKSESAHPPRSASLPRMVKSTKKSAEMSARSSQTRKPIIHPAQKRKDVVNK